MNKTLCTPLILLASGAAKNLPRDDRLGKDWVERQGGIVNAARHLLGTFRNFSMGDDQALRTNLSGVPAKYIFEQSTTLIRLPDMPVEFARERVEPIRPLLERIQAETAIPRAVLDASMSFAEREALAPLFSVG